MARKKSTETKNISNSLIADELTALARALELKGESRFKVKAYRMAAGSVLESEKDLQHLVREGGSLRSLPGVGAGIAAVIEEILRSGKLVSLKKVRASLPKVLQELDAYPKLSRQLVERIYRKLDIGSIDQLKTALKSGQLLEKLGTRVEMTVSNALSSTPLILRSEALRIAQSIRHEIQGIRAVEEVHFAGALRRQCETIDEIALVVVLSAPSKIAKYFSKFKSYSEKGGESIRFQGPGNCFVQIFIVRPDNLGAALVLHTGSSQHLAALSSLEPISAPKVGSYREERDFYASVGLPLIHPALREGTGEIEAALQKKLPNLIEIKNLLGDLHMHSTGSDGANTILEMAHAAKNRGYHYIGITDHSRSLKIAGGLSEAKLLKQLEHIDRLNEKLKDFRIFKGSEVDILEDGSLDYSQRVLKQLDYTVCSIHSRFGLDRKRQTDRMLRAIDNPYCTIIGHATGRKLLRRPGYEIDIEKILKALQSRKVFIEINSSPDRLDLNYSNARHAAELGILVAINTDAHSIAELNFMQGGVDQAQRAWLTKGEVLNTRGVAQLEKLFRRSRN